MGNRVRARLTLAFATLYTSAFLIAGTATALQLGQY